MKYLGEMKTPPIQNSDTNVLRKIINNSQITGNDPNNHQLIETNKMRPTCKMKYHLLIKKTPNQITKWVNLESIMSKKFIKKDQEKGKKQNKQKVIPFI